jgi:hypothetical protein
MSLRNRPSAILNDPGVREYFALIEIARSQVAHDSAIVDKERCARSMVDAYYQGQLDREQVARLAAV